MEKGHKRALVSVRATIQDEITKILKYIRRKAPNDKLICEHLRQQKPIAQEEAQKDP